LKSLGVEILDSDNERKRVHWNSLNSVKYSTVKKINQIIFPEIDEDNPICLKKKEETINLKGWELTDTVVMGLLRPLSILSEDFRKGRSSLVFEKIPHFEKEIDVLITLGGTDIRNLVPKLLDILKSINAKLKIAVVMGKISEDIKKLETDYIKIFSNIEALEMRNFILKSKFIICGCGQSIYEMLALKANFLPILIIDNQEKNKEFLLKNKFVEDVLDYNEEKEKFCDVILKQLFLERNNKIILDVKGSKRIIDFFLEEK